MHSIQTPLMCAGGAVLASLLSLGSPAPLGAEDPKDVAALRKQVAELEAKVTACESFMKQQATAGAALADALARSEAEGFTAGINPRSREILLDGLRSQAKAMRAGAGAEDEDGKGSSRRARRRDR